MESRVKIMFVRILISQTFLPLIIVLARDAQILSVSENIIALPGEEVQLNCTVKNLNDNKISWVKGSQTIASNNEMQFKNNRFVVNFDENRSLYSLKISNIQENDRGLYFCRIMFNIDDNLDRQIKLDIKRSPTINNLTSVLSVNRGDPIHLECKADGIPEPNITWKRANNEIFGNGGLALNGRSVNIQFADKTDRGKYYCIADNGVEPSDKRSVEVRVEFAPEVYALKPKIGLPKGSDAELLCNIEAYPPPEITWLKNDKEIVKSKPISSNAESLSKHHINLIGSADYGLYTCRVENSLGTAQTSIELFETEPIKYLEEKKGFLFFRR